MNMEFPHVASVRDPGDSKFLAGGPWLTRMFRSLRPFYP